MLILTPAPVPTESLFGYTLRVSESNGYDSPWHVLDLAHYSQSEMFRTGFDVGEFASVLNRSATELYLISYVSTPSQGEKGYKLLGHNLGTSFKLAPLRARRPSICPQCIENQGHIEAFWDLSYAVACPKHGTLAVSKCHACDQPLKWFRPGLLKCKCTADLSEAPLVAASPAVISMMRVLYWKVHGLAPDPDGNIANLPIDQLLKLPLLNIIQCINGLGKYALSSNSANENLGYEAILTAAAEILSDWPHNFHSLLRKLAVLYENNKIPSGTLRKAFTPFYEAMFKRRSSFSFLRDEFINFGLTEWGDGLVDTRMTKNADVSGRYLSKTKLARMIGVDPRTIISWGNGGKIAIKPVLSDKRTRYVCDLNSINIPIVGNGKIFDARAAGKFIGLPVSVLNELKSTGRYKVEHLPRFKPSFHQADLEIFEQSLLANSVLLTDTAAPTNAITLEYVMQEKRFWSGNGKAEFLSHYLDHKIRSVGRTDDTIQSILFDANDVHEIAVKLREQASNGAISITETAKLLNCDDATITGLIESGQLVSVTGPERTRVFRESAEEFAAEYVSLTGIMRKFNSTGRMLYRLCKNLSISMVTIKKKNGLSGYFIPTNQEPLLVEEIEGKRRKRASPEDSLKRYFEDLRQNNAQLPRTGNVPNKAAISKACGFERSAFYKNAAAESLLDAFDLEDANRYDIPPSMTPQDALHHYLQKLAETNTPLPMCNGKPNKFAIARACRFNRVILSSNPHIDTLLQSHIERH